MPEFDFNAFVKTLPQEKLAELVIRFAPESYQEELKNQHLSDLDAKRTFDRIVKSIKDLLEDEDLWDEPSEFDSSLTGLAEKLSGLWDRFQEETGQLFLFSIKRIEAIQDEGRLYRHWPEEYYDGCGFLAVIQQFARSLPFNQKIEFVSKLENILQSYGYDTFYSYPRELDLIFKESDQVLLKNWFLKSLKVEENSFHKHYYHFLKDTLSLAEKAIVLENIYHQESGLCLDLVETLVALKMAGTAISYLEELRKVNPDPWIFTQELFIKLVELKKSEGMPFFEDLISGLKKYKTDSLLEKSIGICPERSLELEALVKSNSHYYFLKYLINSDRIEEAHQLVLTSKSLDDQSVLNFFKTYCEKYPSDSTNYFTKLIDKELVFTGDRHYESIVNSLEYIFKISPSKALEITSMIKRDYKRRRNLVAMLEQKF
jgi:hypothetical protein